MFQVSALSRSRFEHLFGLDDEELRQHNAVRRVVTAKPGFPCRISLEDAEPGEQVLLVNFVHQDANSPFRASHAVYVRPSAPEAHPAEDEVPQLFRTRVMSLRAFDGQGLMLAAELADGRDMERSIASLFGTARVEYLHAHFAAPGCYAARIERR